MEVGRTQAALLLREYDCCPRCVQRMLYGATSQAKDFIQIPGAVRESPLCPVCCGVLHHPQMCTLPPNYTRASYQSPADENEHNLLAELLCRLDSSDFEYLGCMFKVSVLTVSLYVSCIRAVIFYELVRRSLLTLK